MQGQPSERLCGYARLVVNAENPSLSQWREIKFEPRELLRIRDFELKFLVQLAPKGLQGPLAVVQRTTEATPVVGIENIRQRIAQLHQIAAVVQEQNRGDSIA